MGTSQIIAIGGGGFSCGTDPELDTYVLQQSTAAQPRIGFIGTASGDASQYLVKFYARFSQLNCRPSHLEFFGRTPDLEEWVGAQDIIYVGGGNTRSMLAVWHAWGLPAILKKAMQNGTVLAGISAGAICWFEQGVTDSNAGKLGALPGLGFLAGSCCPHYSEEKARKPAFEAFVANGGMPGGIAIDDGAAVHFIDGMPHRLVAGRPGADAYRVTRSLAGAVSERAVPD